MVYLLREQERQLLANYLARHPWAEVNDLMALLSRLPPMPQPKGDQDAE